MRRTGVLLAAVVVLTLASVRTAPADDKEPKSTAAKEVEKAYRDYLDATTKKNEKALLAALAEDYTLMVEGGKTYSRIGVIGLVTNPDIDWESNTANEVKVRVYNDDAAVITARYTEKGKRNGVAFSNPIQSTVTLVKKDGSWVLVAEHVTDSKK